MPAPKVYSEEETHPVGDVQYPTSIFSWKYDALIASQSRGAFYVWKRHVMFSGSCAFRYSVYGGFLRGSNLMFGAIGPPTGPPSSLPSQAPPLQTQLDRLQQDYPTAYRKMRPGNPQASVAQFLGELRDLPQLPLKHAFLRKRKGDQPWYLAQIPTTVPLRDVPRRLREALFNYKNLKKNLGSEWLNYNFGWKPFVSDLRKMYNLYKTIDKRIDQLRREANKSVSRAATVSRTATTEAGPTFSDLKELPGNLSDPGTDPRDVNITYPYPFWGVHGAPPNFGWTGTSQLSVVRTTNERVWSTSHWKNYMPNSSSSQWTRKAKLALFGALPTPEVLWELMPWSWLVDWFSNVGDIMSNISPNANDGQVLESSYIMRGWEQKTTYSVNTTVDSPPSDGSAYWTSGSYTFHAEDTTTIKTRAGSGNPYGLSVKLESLSPYQLSILAALGISRGKVK